MKNTEPKVAIYLGKDEALQQDVELLRRLYRAQGSSLSKKVRPVLQGLIDENRAALDKIRGMVE